jgi:hypothetical protein
MIWTYIFQFLGVDWDWVHLARRPPFSLLYQPRMIMMMMSVEQSVEWELAGENEIVGENLPQCHFVHQKLHMTWPGIELEPQRWKAGDVNINQTRISLTS